MLKYLRVRSNTFYAAIIVNNNNTIDQLSTLYLLSQHPRTSECTNSGYYSASIIHPSSIGFADSAYVSIANILHRIHT